MWLALYALLVNLLLPPTVLAKPANNPTVNGGFDLIVCGPEGMRVIPLDGQPSPDQSSAAYVPHCGACLPGAGSAMLPPPAAASVPVRFATGPAFGTPANDAIAPWAWANQYRARGPPVRI